MDEYYVYIIAVVVLLGVGDLEQNLLTAHQYGYLTIIAVATLAAAAAFFKYVGVKPESDEDEG
jgi:hypothetical protein